nr:hypothetical protein CFP56_27984 [Quercus suber]
MRGALLLKLLSDDVEAHAELASIILAPQASLSLFVSYWVRFRDLRDRAEEDDERILGFSVQFGDFNVG